MKPKLRNINEVPPEEIKSILAEAERKHKLADVIRNELLMIHESGRLEDDYRKTFPGSFWGLPYTFIEHLENAGYIIIKKENEK